MMLVLLKEVISAFKRTIGVLCFVFDSFLYNLTKTPMN